jgi:signal transduction histidine kinase
VITSSDGVARRILGIDAAELHGQSLFELLGQPPTPLEDLEGELHRASECSGGDDCRMTLCSLASDSSWYAVISDLSGVRRALNKAAHVEAREEARMLISGFAHEVRNPIAAILSMTEALLQSSRCPEFVEEMVRPVPKLVRRIESVISDSVNYSRPDEPVPARVDAERVVADVLASHPPSDDVQVHVDGAARAPIVRSDPWHTRRIVRALLDNAYQAGAEHIHVVIDAYPNRGTRLGVSIKVLDDGSGVDDDVREQIFRPFFTTRAQQTGLGLASARSLAQLNHGRLAFNGTEDDKTCFELLLPEGRNANLAEVAEDVG